MAKKVDMNLSVTFFLTLSMPYLSEAMKALSAFG